MLTSARWVGLALVLYPPIILSLSLSLSLSLPLSCSFPFISSPFSFLTIEYYISPISLSPSLISLTHHFSPVIFYFLSLSPLLFSPTLYHFFLFLLLININVNCSYSDIGHLKNESRSSSFIIISNNLKGCHILFS